MGRVTIWTRVKHAQPSACVPSYVNCERCSVFRTGY